MTVDGVVQGTTAPEAAGSAESSPLLVDLELGPHRLTFRRSCYVTAERDVVIDRLADLRIDAVRLTPAVASAKVESPVSAATVLLDGVVRGTVASADLTSICEGDHLLEVRSAGGRFIHRDRWTAGEHKTIKAVLRPAFATVGMPDARARRLVPAEALTVERMLQDVPTVLVFATAESDLEAALAEEKLNPEALATTLGDAAAGRHADVVRDVGARLSARLRAQGLAWVAPAADGAAQVELPDGPGVSGGTVAYLMGLCYEALSRSADARAAFTRAAGVADSTLWFEGPLVAPLAQQRLAVLR